MTTPPLPGLGARPTSHWTPPAEPNRQARRVNKAATLAALRARRGSGDVGTSTPTTEGARETINTTLAGTAQALKQGLPGVDFMLIGLRSNGAGKADVFLKSTLAKENALAAAEVLEGLARFFRDQTAATPPETSGGQ